MPKIIHVKIKPDGTPECTPQVTRVRPGGTLVWRGKPHHGSFEGLVPGPPKDDFTLAELQAITPQPVTLPFTPHGWAIVNDAPGFQNPDTIVVDANAQSGKMYKYTVTAGGQSLDPIIIVDDTATDS
jgi:hypothetical protein